MPSRSKRWPAPPATRWPWSRNARADKAAVLDALGVAASALRARLGESLASVRAMDVPLARATTAVARRAQGLQPGRGQPACRAPTTTTRSRLYRRALELDPDFALAHARLGTVLSNRDAVDASIQHQRRAYELRDRVSEYERLYITSHYYGNVTDEVPKYLEVLRVWQQHVPQRLHRAQQPGRDPAAARRLRRRPRRRARGAAAGAAQPAAAPQPQLGAAVQRRAGRGVVDRAGRPSTPTSPPTSCARCRRGRPTSAATPPISTGSWPSRARSAGAASAPSGASSPWHLLRQGKTDEAIALWTALGDRDRQAGRQEAQILAQVKLARLHALLGRDGGGAGRGARRRRPWSARRGRRSSSAWPWSMPATSRARERWMARLRAASPDSTFVNQLEIPQVQAALALRARQPERALDALAPVGSLDALVHRLGALPAHAGAPRGRPLPRGDGRGGAVPGAAVAHRAAGHRPRAAAGIRAGRGRGRRRPARRPGAT